VIHYRYRGGPRAEFETGVDGRPEGGRNAKALVRRQKVVVYHKKQAGTQGNRLTGKENRIVDLLGGGLASSISPDLSGVRISPTREGVGVNGGALAERLRPGVTGT
jgi:hypothetical protein